MSDGSEAPDCPFCEHPLLAATLVALLAAALALQVALLWLQFG